ncbi:MAG: hypothetical protein ACI965_002015 [Paraglaciecola sp.]|jgi:hypothetical protein
MKQTLSNIDQYIFSDAALVLAFVKSNLAERAKLAEQAR